MRKGGSVKLRDDIRSLAKKFLPYIIKSKIA
jgi:hypothetical protein